MGKKSKNMNVPRDQHRGLSTDFGSLLQDIGCDPTIQKQELKEENKYSNYDPDKHQRSNKGNSSQNNSSRSNSNEKNKVHVLPVKEGPFAPYNFVRINNEVLDAPENGKYSTISDETYDGEIQYRLTAETPILIDDGNEQFYRNKDGVFAIPGSTMRGLIRNNVQILGLSSVRDDIDDYNLMYRAVAGSCLSKEYADTLGQTSKIINGHRMSRLEYVKAGYISHEGQDYYLYNNIGDSDHSFKNGEADYYVVNEKYVLEKAEDNFKDIIDKFQNNETFQKHNDHENGYVPYSMPIKYEVSNGKIFSITKNGRGNPGYVLSSGKMEGKKAFYVIPDIDTETKRIIPKDRITAYQIDYNRREKTIPEKARSFYQLPDDGITKPVFYIEHNGKMYFGFTPHLRLMYDHMILDGLKQEEKPVDFAKSIFGFSNDKDSRKSKVFFTDAVLTGDKNEAEEKKLILSEPKPTSYLEYLKQSDGKNVSTYNSDTMELRGIKQYWLHKDVTDGAPSDKEKVKSVLHPLKSGCSFEGSIRFQNLTKEELGLLIWSIALENDARMNIGKAKAYGYGRIKVEKTDLYLMNRDVAYQTSVYAFQDDPYVKQKEEEKMSFIEDYKRWATKLLGQDIMKNPTIQDFFTMKSCQLDGKMVEYMSLDEFSGFKKQNNPLPTVQDVYKEMKKTNSGGKKE